MDSWMKAVLTVAIIFISCYLLVKRTGDGNAREVAMWLLGALMGFWFR
jgi:hypothetical protein